MLGRDCMHLHKSQSLDKGIDGVNRDLLALIEDDMHTFQERYEVFMLDITRWRLLKETLDDCIEGGYEVFLIDIESGTRTHFDYLKGAQESSQDI